MVLRLISMLIVIPVLAMTPLHGQAVRKRPLGPAVNTTTHRELLPVVSPDGRTLWFIREGADTALGERYQSQAEATFKDLEAQLAKLPPEQRKQMEATLAEMRKSLRSSAAPAIDKQTIWVSQRQADGSWGPATRAPAPLNDEVSPSGVVTALPDGNTVLAGKFDVSNLFADLQREVGQMPPDAVLAGRGQSKPAPLVSPDPSRDNQNTAIGLSRRTPTGWSAIELLRIIGYAHKSGARSDYYLAPNGRVLLLSLINSESQNGSRDLFVSQLQNDGRWSKPAVMAAINSPADEISPWIAPDNQTVYFASAREGGRGDFDIWMARRQDDSWQKWSPPQNLGAEINTPQADMNLAVDATGRLAFMSMGERGKEDIYEFELPAAMRPTPVAFVRGTVKDPAGKPVPAGIVYELLAQARMAGQANADPKDGRYQIALPIGEDYGFRATAAGYIAVSDRVDLRAAKDQQVFERDLVLIPIATGVAIRLNNVFFETGKAELLPESRAELDRLAAMLRDQAAMRIEVRGHTDSVDDDAANLKLSEARAAAVVAYLANAGIAAARLERRGFGETQPVAPNTTDAGRQQNRRVEFVILSR